MASSVLTDDQRDAITAAVTAWRRAQRALSTMEGRLREDLADAHPDDPPPGERLRGADRGAQRQLSELSGYTGSHLREVRKTIRAQRREKGKDVRYRDRGLATERVQAALDALHGTQAEREHARTRGEEQPDLGLHGAVAVAYRAVADAVEAALPYTGPDVREADRSKGHIEAAREVMALTGEPRHQIRAMQRDAAQRREAAAAGLAAPRREVNGGVTHSCLAAGEE